ncbi:ankyrin repeat-containing domain protein, partial [Umbelopsis sp. AD052]
EGWSALHIAAHLGYDELATILCNKKANVNQTTKQGQTPLYLASDRGDLKMVLNVLLNCGCNIEPIDNNGNTTLHYAVLNNNPAAVKLLVQRGVNMEIRNKYGRTAFHTAVECDNLQIVELLINYDVNINAITHGIKTTPLQFAIQRNNLCMIQFLLDHNVSVNVKGDAGDTALHTAVRTGKDAIVSLLLRQDVKLNARNSFGATPL